VRYVAVGIGRNQQGSGMIDDDGFGTFMILIFVAFGVFTVAVIVGMVVAWRKNARALRAGGLDPWTAEAQLATRVANSQMLSPAAQPTTLEQRLAEVDDLARRGVISADELAAARARILGD
jgi:hypothetical protein